MTVTRKKAVRKKAVRKTSTVKNKGGRPRHFDDPEKMQPLIDAYFDDCDAKEEPYTVPGLAYALGFSYRQAINEYEKDVRFSDTIKMARLRIEQQRNRGLLRGDGSTAGHIFDLKNNFGWKDQQDVNLSGGITLEAPKRVRTV